MRPAPALLLLASLGLLAPRLGSPARDKYPFLAEDRREVADRGEFFVTKEKLKHVLFVFFNEETEPEEAFALQWG